MEITGEKKTILQGGLLRGLPIGGDFHTFKAEEVVAFGLLRIWGDSRTHFWVRLVDGSECLVRVSNQEADAKKFLNSFFSKIDRPRRPDTWSMLWVSKEDLLKVTFADLSLGETFWWKEWKSEWKSEENKNGPFTKTGPRSFTDREGKKDSVASVRAKITPS